MGRYPETVESAIRSYLDDMRKRGGYSELSIRSAEQSTRCAFAIVHRFQPDAVPRNITPDTLRNVLEYLKDNYAVSTQKSYFFYIRELMKMSNNRAYEDIRVVYPTDIRPNVDWLTLDDALILLRAPKSETDDMIVSLALLHGLRRTEICTLRITDIHEEGTYITVLGKGKGGGKFRSVHYHPTFHTTFKRWMAYRTNLALKCRDDVSDNALLVYIQGGKLRKYQSRSINNRLKALSESLGISFSPHTLRRTFGREMYHSGVKIETIARIMGHSSTEMTLKYIGINLDDQALAMSQFILR